MDYIAPGSGTAQSPQVSGALPQPPSATPAQVSLPTPMPLPSPMPLPKRPVTPLGLAVQQLQEAISIAQQTSAAPELVTALQQAYALTAGLDPYLERCTAEESPALAALAQKTAVEDWGQRFAEQATVQPLEQEMLSGHVEGQALKLLIQMSGATRILEVGMFTGYSALAMAEALPEAGRVVACEVDPYAAKIARTCFDASPYGHKIEIRVAPALQTLADLAAARQRFDFAFIDANKQEYWAYFNHLLDGDLIGPGGIICVDNTLFQGQPYLPAAQQTANGRAIAAFNRAVAADPRVDQVLLPLRDGLTLIRRRP